MMADRPALHCIRHPEANIRRMVVDTPAGPIEDSPPLELLLCSACSRVLAYQGGDHRPQLMLSARLL